MRILVFDPLMKAQVLSRGTAEVGHIVDLEQLSHYIGKWAMPNWTAVVRLVLGTLRLACYKLDCSVDGTSTSLDMKMQDTLINY